MQVPEEEEDRCDQAEDKKPPTEEVITTMNRAEKDSIEPICAGM